MGQRVHQGHRLVAWQGLAVALGLLLASGHGMAQTYSEKGDAGSQVVKAQDVQGGVTTVLGALGFAGDVDLFRMWFDFTGSLTLRVSGSGFDPNLHLFTAGGKPLGANDDEDIRRSLDSALTIQITPGSYLIGVCDNNCEATDARGSVIQDNDFGIMARDGVLGGWMGSGTTERGRTGTYTLSLSTSSSAPSSGVPFATPVAAVVTTPEPATMALLGAGMIGLALFRWRR